MAKLFQFFLLLLVVAAMVWLAMLWRWHVQEAEPNAAELAIYLVAVPVTLTMGLVFCLWQIKKLRAFASAPLVVQQPVRPAAAAPAPLALPAGVLILVALGKSRLGPHWDFAQQAAAAGEHMPKLHPNLVDNRGLPAFVAPVDEMDLVKTRKAWDTWVDDGHWLPRASAGDPPEAWLRAMALLSPLVREMQLSLKKHWTVLSSNLRQQQVQQVEGQPSTQQPCVRIELGVAAHWLPLWQQAAGEWVRHQMDSCIQAGLRAAGQAGAMAQTSRAVIQFEVHPVECPVAFWAALEQHQQRWVDQGVPGLMVALVADSLLSQPQVTALDAQECLMTARRGKGRVPGEAAAAILMATPAWLESPDCPGMPPLARMQFAHAHRRDQSADAKGAQEGSLLSHLALEAVVMQNLNEAAVKHLTVDGDHRRQGELQEVVHDVFPALDVFEDVLCSGVACGDTGVARWLFTLALAVNKVQTTQAPGLVLGNFDEWQRLALLLTPVPPDRAADVTDPESKAA